GEAKSAIGYTGHSRDDIGPNDYVVLQILFENGGIGTMYDVSSVEGYNRNDIVITGSDGTMVLNPPLGGDSLTVTDRYGNSVCHHFKNDYYLSFIREFEDFYHAIRNKRPPKSTFEEGYKDLKLAFTAIQTNDRWNGLKLVE
ncbi:MAG: hypothetical protein LBS57_10510, partial [Treponema sp.]|nr:hypothetical protein [Treponema sp.]